MCPIHRQQTTMSRFSTNNRRDYEDLMEISGAFPATMAGHFWVVRDGRVIDPKFSEHRQIQRQNRLQDVSCHLPAPVMTQKVMMASHIRASKKVFGENYATEFQRLFENRSHFGMCFFNAVMEQHRNGGEIVFGSMGWLRDDDTEYFEYGGRDFQVVADFTGKSDVYMKGVREELLRNPKFLATVLQRHS